MIENKITKFWEYIINKNWDNIVNETKKLDINILNSEIKF